MSINTETVSTQFINQSFLDKIDSGMEKEASVAMTAFVRQKLREGGFTRKILTPTPITAAELDRDLHEEPRVIVEKEPDSKAATMSFLGRPEIRYWTTPRYEVRFNKLSSDRFKKSKFELATYRTDIRTVLQENSVKDLQRKEDEGFYSNLVQIASDNSNIFNISGGFNIPNFHAAMKNFHRKELPVGCLLMNHSTYADWLAQPSTQIGSDASSAIFRGAESVENPYGYKIVTTNKHDIVPDGQIIVFAPQAYLGQFYELQAATVFLKTEADIIDWEVYESIGAGIGNVNGFVILNF